MIRLSEFFTSVQGEGIWTGIPSTFIRFSGCNLRCVWCDTPYASWEPEGPMTTVDDLIERVSQAGIRHVVITGGEPMLFEPIVDLCERLNRAGHIITMETAGTVYRDLPCDLMSISPKLSHSTPHEGRHVDGSVTTVVNQQWIARHEASRLNIPILTSLMNQYNTQLKFVVTREADLLEIEGLLDDLPTIDPARVLLMPEGRDSQQLNTAMRALVPVVMERGWRLCGRLHIDLFGDVRET